MARSIENKLVQFPLNHGMDQSVSPRVAPPGTLYSVVNCRKRGPGGLLESRPGMPQLVATCAGSGGIGPGEHYIAGDGTTAYVYRPSFVTYIGSAPLLGTTAGEAFCYSQGAWQFSGRFSTCLPIERHAAFAPLSFQPGVGGGNPPFPPQVAINQNGAIMCAQIDSGGALSAFIETADGVRQVIQYGVSNGLVRARLVAMGAAFFLFFQSGTSLSVNKFTQSSGSITYAELGLIETLPGINYYWDATAGDAATATVMYLAFSAGDGLLNVISLNSALSVVNSVAKPVGAGATPLSLYLNPATNAVWLGFNDISGGVTGADTNANVNTTVNKTIRIRANKASAYSSITVTSGAATPKTTIVTDLNTAFSGAGLTLLASIVGTNQIKIVSTGSAAGVPGFLVDIDTVANGSNLSTAIGFTYAGANVINAFGGQTYAIFSSVLAVVLDHSSINTFSSLRYGPPLFGLHRSTTPNTNGTSMYVFGDFEQTGSKRRAMYVGTATTAGVVSTETSLTPIFPVSKPDNYGRVWVMIDSGAVDTSIVSSGTPAFKVTRYALLRFYDLTLDTTVAQQKLISPPTIELVSDGYVSISQVFQFAFSGGGTYPADYFAPAASLSGNGSAYFPLWAGLETLTGSSLTLTGITSNIYSLMQAQILEYSCAEFDEPGHTHRDADQVQNNVLVAGQPVELFGQSTAQVLYGSTGIAIRDAYAAGASEVGFLHPPIVTATANGAGGAAPAAGTYQYKFVYQWIDALGRRHQSEPSLPTQFTADGAHAVSLTVWITHLSQRNSRNSPQQIEIIMYRTVAGGTSFHETMQRGSVASSVQDFSFTFTDTFTDAQISSNGDLYTDGGVLPNAIAPSCRFHARSEDRVWFGGLWDPTIIQCSKIIVPGEPIQTPDSDAFRVQLLRPCTGLAYLDGQMIAFAKDAIFLINGNGPNDQGNGSFAVRPFTATIGCIDYRSILETEAGIFFQSAHGLYRIPRGFGPPEFIGAGVQVALSNGDALDAQPEILGAVYSATNQGQYAVFLKRSPSQTTGGSSLLVFDLDTGEWVTDQLTNLSREIGYWPSAPGHMLAAASFDSSAGAVYPIAYQSLADRYDYTTIDNVKTIQTMQIITAWVAPFGLGGWGRFNKVMVALETSVVPLTLGMTVQLDSAQASSGSWAISGAGQTNIGQYRQLWPDPTQGTAAQVTLTLAPTTTATAGTYSAKFIGLTFEVDPSDGIRLLADAERG